MSDLSAVEAVNSTARQSGVAASIAQFENLGTHAQYRIPYAIAARVIRSGDRVLDWGCGNGHFSLLLESLGARVTGYSYEPFPQALAGSPTFRFVAGTEGDPRSLPFPDAMFDAALSVGVLEHVWEMGGSERASLGELSRVLKPGGALLTFHLPNRTGWIERVVHALRLKKYSHRRKFDRTEIHALWGEAGFEVSEIGLYNALPRNELTSLPRLIRHARSFVRAYDTADDAIGRVMPRVCTNYFVVARRTRRVEPRRDPET